MTGRSVAERGEAPMVGGDRVRRPMLLAGAVAVVTTSVVAPPVAIAALVAGAALVRRRRRSAAARDEWADATVGAVAELMAVATASGSTPGHALATAHRLLPSAWSSPASVRSDVVVGLGHAIASLEAGAALDAALGAWSDAVPQAGPLVTLVVDAHRTGAPVTDALRALAAESRARQRRARQVRARRLPVTSLVPLVVCVLPGFVLLTVVPLVAVGLRGVAVLR